MPGSRPAESAAIAIDLRSGRPLFERNADASLAPASNEKLLVTYAALASLGTGYRFRTEVLSSGHQDGATWHGNVYLKGFGDPTLTSHGLARLAAQLKTAGIERIDGRVVGDESWFDARRTAPGWKSSFFLFESPPLSALVVDHGVYDNHLSLDPALAAAGRFKQLLRAQGHRRGTGECRQRPGGGGRARPGRVGCPAERAARDGPRQRQLHRRADAQATRRREGYRRNDRRRRRRCAARPGRGRRSADRRAHGRRLRAVARRPPDGASARLVARRRVEQP